MFNKTYIILFILCNSYFSFAQPHFHGAGKSSIDFGILYSSSSSFYDLDGKSKIYTKDTFNILLDGVTEYQYALKRTFEFRKYTMMLGFNMNLTDELTLTAEVPLSFMSLKEKYEFDTNRFSPTYNSQKIISDFSLFKPDYYKISFYYTLLNDVSFPIITGAVYMPPNLTNGYQNDTSGNFKYYSAYQFYLGLIYDFKFTKSFIDLESGFFYRTGDFNNKLFVKIDAGVSTVENTSLHGIILFNQNLGGYKNARMFNPAYTTLQETSFDLGASFNALINKRINIDFAFFVRLGITNTMTDQRFQLKSSWLLD